MKVTELHEEERLLAAERKDIEGADDLSELDGWAETLRAERERQSEWGARTRDFVSTLDAQPGDLLEYAVDGHRLTGLMHYPFYLGSVDDDGLWGERVLAFGEATVDNPVVLVDDPTFVAWADLLDVRIVARQVPTISSIEYERQREQARREAEARAEFEAQVEREVTRRAIVEEAKRRIRGTRDEALPQGLNLADFLATELPEDPFLIDGLLPTGGNALLAASAKSGKSTMIHNLIRSFVDGDPFLGAFNVTEFRRVALLDFELSAKMLQTWLSSHEMEHAERVSVFPMRGRTSTFDILDPKVRTEWSHALQGVDVLILDPLLPLLAALGLDHNSEVAPFLDAFDALKTEAGISEGIIVHHYGHGAQRATGDSRLLGWPDALWDVSWDDPEDFGSLRLFHARGRDVDVPKTPLRLDGRRLTLDGSVSSAKQDIRLEKVLEFLRSTPESDRDTILAASLRGVNSATFHSVTREAIEAGRIVVRTVGKGRKLYSAGE